MEDGGVSIGFFGDSIRAFEESGVIAAERTNSDMGGIEDFDSRHEGTIVAAGDNDMSGRPDPQEIAAEQDMQME